jgi:hypothetical protein
MSKAGEVCLENEVTSMAIFTTDGDLCHRRLWGIRRSRHFTVNLAQLYGIT